MSHEFGVQLPGCRREEGGGGGQRVRVVILVFMSADSYPSSGRNRNENEFPLVYAQWSFIVVASCTVCSCTD